MSGKGLRKSSQAPELSTPLREIIADVDRFRMMTNEALQLRRFPDHSANAVAKITAKICRKRYLQHFPLVARRRYFVLGRKSVNLLGISERRVQPLGAQALPLHYGVLAYCCLGAARRDRLNPRELAEQYNWMGHADLLSLYCLDEATLAFIRVDLGGSPQHITRKCRHDVRRRMEVPQFRKLIDEGCFRIIIVTATAEKASAVSESLSAHTWPITFRTAVVPDLLPLLT